MSCEINVFVIIIITINSYVVWTPCILKSVVFDVGNSASVKIRHDNSANNDDDDDDDDNDDDDDDDDNDDDDDHEDDIHDDHHHDEYHQGHNDTNE